MCGKKLKINRRSRTTEDQVNHDKSNDHTVTRKNCKQIEEQDAREK